VSNKKTESTAIRLVWFALSIVMGWLTAEALRAWL